MTASTIPNGQRYPVETTNAYAVECFAKLTGGGAASDLVNADSANRGGGEVASAVYAGSTGTYTITFRKAWPALLFPPVATFVNATADFNMKVVSIDIANNTASVVFNSNTTPADVATTTDVYLRWTVLAVNKR